MTKKDFSAIAAAISEARDVTHRSDPENLVLSVIEDVARRIADVLEHNNPNFDYLRFLKACGVSE